MGGRTVTMQALEVVKVDAKNNLLLVKGAVPGHNRSIVFIRKSRKLPKAAPAKPPKKKAAVQPTKPSPGAGKAAAGKKK
jgi:large subunit ribosomal protein L3